jgi:hypothetical protein
MDKQRELQALIASTNKTDSDVNDIKLVSKSKDRRNDGGYIWII